MKSSSSGSESDLGELAALFSAHSGGSLSAEVSADLALDIVLNEIVEQACVGTGATGAAIILERDGEMVCRASSGVNAPEMGARLESESGLTAECIRTWRVQRCDDALTDPRADAEASRSLGVRSVLVFPLLRNGLAGLLEVFSSRAAAFSERDELVLDALAHRILKNLDRASEASSAPSAAEIESIPKAFGIAEPAPAAKVAPEIAAQDREEQDREEFTASPDASSHEHNKENEIPGETFAKAPPRFDIVTFALGTAVVLCAMLLTTLIVLRVSARRVGSGHDREPNEVSANSSINQKNGGPNGAAQLAGGLGVRAVEPSAFKTGSATVAAGQNSVRQGTSAGRSKGSPPEGSLLVYENGKEVFRMPPGGEAGTPAENGEASDGMERASSVEPAEVIELSPEAADGSLVHRVEPEYPDAARQAKMQGPVVLDIRIGRDGSVQDVKMVSGQRLLADAAIAAVKQWRFKPQALKGQPVEMQTRVTLNFRMPG